MTIHIANAPCSWGVDDPKNPYLPPWSQVLQEAATAGYKSIELGPWSYLPTQADELRAALNKQGLSLVAGTIFDDLVSEENFANIVELTHNLCRNLSQVPSAEKTPGNPFQPPFLVIIISAIRSGRNMPGAASWLPACHPPTGSGWSTTL